MIGWNRLPISICLPNLPDRYGQRRGFLRHSSFCSIYDAGVDEFVQDDDVFFAKQRADSALRRGEAGGKSESGFGLFELGEGSFQFMERSEGAADQTGCAGACAEFFDGVNGGFFESVVIGQAEVIVGREVEERFAVHFYAWGDCDESTRRSSRNRFCSRRLVRRWLNSASKDILRIYDLGFRGLRDKNVLWGMWCVECLGK